MFILPSSDWSVKTTPDRGRGVFATKPIPAGTIIGDYLGKVIGLDEEDDSEAIYSMDYRTNACIMPDPKQVGVHLINHSCMPNCFMYPYQGHILIVSARLILPDEELNYMYYISPIKTSVGPVHACFCQTPFCHGTMYTNSIKTHQQRTLLRTIDPLLATTASPAEFGQEITLLPHYPQKPLPDVELYDVFGSLQSPPYEVTEAEATGKIALQEKFIRNMIRKTGRCLKFKDQNLIVIGMMNRSIVSIELSQWDSLTTSPLT